MLSLVNLQELYPEQAIQAYLADSAMNCNAMYALLDHHDIHAVIDLDQRNSAPEKQDDMTFDKKGRPICP